MHALGGQTGLATLSDSTRARKPTKRRYFIGGSDAQKIMGDDEAALVRLWREKRGEIEPEDTPIFVSPRMPLAAEKAVPVEP